MDDDIRLALATNGVIDITTIGRRSGEPRRIEIYMHAFDGRIVISGMPMPGRTRAWIHNLEADPSIVIHLKRGVTADLPGTARIVTDPDERRELLTRVARNWKRTDVDDMVAHSPLIEVTIPGFPA
jgi:deazaflavin-dependent oxidoreductase (nitroreductase family)